MTFRKCAAVAALLCLVLSTFAFSQGGNSQLGGIVTDPSGALMPGVSISVQNTDTGITNSAVTNESGAYNFPSLQPGKAYKITASLPGFQAQTITNLELGVTTNLRQNFQLKLGTTSTVVDVTSQANAAITAAGASVGDVLPEARIRNLPLVGNDVLNLLDTLPGLRLSPLGAAGNTIGGLNMDSINVTRDGLNMNDGRYSSTTYGYAVFSSTTINPDLVGEIRLILSPVDAELGRGNSQIQISTRSGTNKYTGAAVWNIQNTALNPNTWANNRTTVNGVWSPTKPDWRNTNEITLSYGGPIIRNKTFFFALYNQKVNLARTTQTVPVMTDTARNGIFRYFTGWNPGNSLTTATVTPTTSTNPIYSSVDDLGKPRAPAVNPDGTPYTGGLRCFSVFGNVKLDGTPFGAADCPGGTAVTGTVWDPLRTTFDASGYIKKVMDLMPRANYFGSGDGLNQATYRWIRREHGANSNAAIVGADVNDSFKQINLKIDQNFTANHKVSGSWTYQKDRNEDNLAQWPGGPNGFIDRSPVIVTINATSTLNSNMLNEFRFGVNHNKTNDGPAWLNSDPDIRKLAESFLLKGGVSTVNGKTYPVVFNPTAGNYGFVGNGYMSTVPSQIGNTTPLYNWADTLSWSHGRHSYKFGAELRLPRSNGFNIQPYPTVAMGNNGGATSTVSPLTVLTNYAAATQLPLLRSNSRTNVANLLYFLNGSISGASQNYWMEGVGNVDSGVWDDTLTKGNRYREQVRSEWSIFAKDDFKLNKTVTLNLGLRWEYYGSPWLRSGLTSAALGLGDGLWGASLGAGGQRFNNWLTPGNVFLTGYGSSTATPLACASGVTQSPLLPASTCDPNQQTKIEFVGPHTPNPGKVAIPNDMNNFGPAVGFAWQPKWFGEGKTSVRGGYQVTFGQAGRDGITIDTLLGSAPGNSLLGTTSVTDANVAAILATRPLNIGDIPTLVPVRPVRKPGATVPIYARSVAYTAYDPEFATPYTQNLTLSVTRTVSRQFTVDVRYIGTLARKQLGNVNLNTNAVFKNKELFDALTLTRAGGDSPLFDQMLAGLNLAPTGTAGYGAVGTCAALAGAPGGDGCAAGQVKQTGSAHIRRNVTLQGNLANGNFNGVIGSLLNLGVTSGLQSLPLDPSTGTAITGTQQRILRNGCDRIANSLYNPAAAASITNIPTRCFPENYFTANPQFSTATYNANLGHSNYHALQVQLNARPIQGLSFQTTYSFAKSMQQPGSGFTDPEDRDLDYARGREGKHSLRMNGTFELPIGPNKLLLGSSHGLLARFVERWQTSFIFNGATGSPADILGAGTMRYANARMVVASPYWKIPTGHVRWNGDGNNSGTFYGNPSPYVSLLDPQCTSSLVGGTDRNGYDLQANCTLDSLGIIVPAGTPGTITLPDSRTAVYGLINPEPGKLGTLGQRTLTYFGQWSLDANISKSFQLAESKSLQVRIDTRNVMNHPIPGIPDFTIDNLGQVTTKSGGRTFQGQLRLTF